MRHPDVETPTKHKAWRASRPGGPGLDDLGYAGLQNRSDLAQFRAGAQQTVVAHNLFLDGSTFGASASVEKNRLVAQTDFGVGVRSPIGLLEWQVHSRGREYRLQPRAHAYSTLSFAFR